MDHDEKLEQEKQSGDRARTFRYLSPEKLVPRMKRERQRKRQQWIRGEIRATRIYWFFSSHIEHPRRLMHSRPTLDRAKYERFRSLVSWTHIARLQSSYAVKLGLTGLIVAPLMATAYLHLPSLQAVGFPKQFGFLFLSGLSFVLSSVLFRMRCPVLLLEVLTKSGQVSGSSRRKDLLEALVSTEFANLVSWRRYPVDRALLMQERDKDELAVTMLAHGWNPALAGYGPEQCALIELAIYEFANRRNVKVWREEFNREKEKFELHPGFGPSITCEGSRPYVMELRIEKARDMIIEEQPEVGKDDLVLHWNETNLDDVSRLPKATDINISTSFAEGLHHLFSSDDNAETFAAIISRWQDHRRGASRLLMFILYAASVALFAVFLWLQTEIVLRALDWI